jgi:hypothetical protein
LPLRFGCSETGVGRPKQGTLPGDAATWPVSNNSGGQGEKNTRKTVLLRAEQQKRNPNNLLLQNYLEK